MAYLDFKWLGDAWWREGVKDLSQDPVTMKSLEGARSKRDRCHMLRGKEVGDKPCLMEGFCEDSMFQKESEDIRHVYCKL